MLSRVLYKNIEQFPFHVATCRLANILNSNDTPLFHRCIQPNVTQFSSSSKPIKETNIDANPFNKTNVSPRSIQHEHDTHDEKLYLQSLNDPDTFGSSNDKANFEESTDSGDISEEQFIENPPNKSKRLSTKQYADIVKTHLTNNRIKEAIDVLETKMIKEDRVKPENYIYNLLIGGTARVGYSKKAFNLYTKMKQRGLKVTEGTYTSLFNACSTCPWPQDGLNTANRLREIMLEKGYEPNASNYNAMIKAFGRCGDIKTAFRLVDEMKSKKLAIEVKTFNFLLQACASDAEYGFRHALIVWHKMLQRRMLPDIYSFNLMLRCVRDCSIGDIETMQQVIADVLLGSKVSVNKSVKTDDNRKLQINDDQQLQIHDNQQLQIDDSSDSNIEQIDSNDQAPNLISRFLHMGSLVALNEVKRAEDRLLLLGGATGFIQEMEKLKVPPNIKTFTELLDVIPSTNTAEHQIVQTIRKLKIKCDIDFFNILIKKRSMRFDYEGAKYVLEMIRIAALQPDIVTYGVLALGCRTIEQAKDLLTEMDDKGIRMNIQILGAMLKQGCHHRHFPYVIEIMRICRKEKLKPNEQFLTHLYHFHHRCFKMRESKNPKVKQIAKSEEFQKDFEEFKVKLDKWREFMGLNTKKLDEAVGIVREHPWEQFQSVEASGMEEVKNPKLRREKKLTRHISRLYPKKLGIENVENLLITK